MQMPVRSGPARSTLKPSPAIPGGFKLNSPENNHAARGFDRDNNRVVAGFGVGMAGTCIGNNREQGGKFIVGAPNPRKAMHSIGWGVTNEILDQKLWRRVLPAADMPHKKAFDFGGLKDIPQMETTGFFGQHVDNWLGMNYD